MNIKDLIKLLVEYRHGSVGIRYGIIRGWSAAYGWHVREAISALVEAGMNIDSYRMNASFCGVVQKEASPLNQEHGIKTSTQQGTCTLDEAMGSMMLIGYSNDQAVERMKTWNLSAHTEPAYVAWLATQRGELS